MSLNWQPCAPTNVTQNNISTVTAALPLGIKYRNGSPCYFLAQNLYFLFKVSHKETQYFPLSMPNLSDKQIVIFLTCYMYPMVTSCIVGKGSRIRHNMESYWARKRNRDRLIFIQTSKSILNRYPAEIRLLLNQRFKQGVWQHVKRVWYKEMLRKG